MDRRAVLPVVIAVLLSVVTATSSGGIERAGSPWPETYGGPQGTFGGVVPGPVVPALRWSRDVADTEIDGAHQGKPEQFNGQLLTLTRGGLLLALAADDSGDTRVDVMVALDPDTGDEVWRRQGPDPNCPPTVDDQGRIWVVAPTGPEGMEFELQALDEATGDTIPGTVLALGTTDVITGMPVLYCNSNFPSPLKIANDGTLLLLSHFNEYWLEAYDVSTIPPSRTWRTVLEDDPQGNRFRNDFRIAPAGGPHSSSVYVFEQRDVPQPDDPPQRFVVAHDLHDGSFLGEVAVPGRFSWTSSIVVDGQTLYVATEEGSNPEVTHLTAITDLGGGDLQVANSVADFDGTAPPWISGNHVRQLATAPGSGLLVGLGGGLVFGISAATGHVAWWHRVDCYFGNVVLDVHGNVYLADFCDEIVYSLAPDGRVRWTMPTEDPVPTVDGGTATMDFSGRAVAIGGDRDVYLTTGGGDNLRVAAVGAFHGTQRRAGPDRVSTAVAVSQETFPDPAGKVPSVVIARADLYPDALSGAPLARSLGGPLLLSTSSDLSSATRSEIRRLGASHAVLLGGSAALSVDVETELEDLGLTVERIAGVNRFDTAAQVANRLGGVEVIIVEGQHADPSRGWPDAVAAAGWAAHTDRPILLVRHDSLPAHTEAGLRSLAPERAVIVGGTAAVSAGVAQAVEDLGIQTERIGGTTRYDTSRLLAARSLDEGADPAVLWLATGTNFPDALSAGPAAAYTGAPLLLVNGANTSGSPEAYEFLADHRKWIDTVLILGGPGAVSLAVEDRVRDVLASTSS